MTWTSGSTLTLSAYRNIAVNANIAGQAIVLHADSSGTNKGTVTFGSGIKATAPGGVAIYYNPNNLDYSNPTNYSDNIAGRSPLDAYMLVNTVEKLQAIGTNLNGTYALGRDIDASITASWDNGAGFSPIGSEFHGIFDGDVAR